MTLPANSAPLPVRDTHPIRIVVALTPRERQLFFTDPQLPFPAAVANESDLAPAFWARQLAQWQPEILITGWSTPPLPGDWLRRPDCPLRYVCHVAGSVRQLVPRSFLERGGIVTNWGARISGQVAEHGLLLALAALRNVGGWAPFLARPAEVRQLADLRTRTLFGRRVGIHGFGSIARALVPLLRPFGVSIIAYSAGVPSALFTDEGVTPASSLTALFASSDVLFECESLTPATQGIVSAAVLAALPDDAIFVNIGRGGLVDDDALLAEAQRGRLRVALDVVSAEPVTPASPFFAQPNVLLSPHIGGPTLDRYADCGAHALANVTSVLAGHRPADAISLAIYDRST